MARLPGQGAAAPAARARPPARLVSVGRPVAGWERSQAFAWSGFPGKTYWRDPRTGYECLGLGIAATVQSLTADRFQAVAQGIRNLGRNAVVQGPDSRLHGPKLIGGLAFTAQYLSDQVWQSFLPACFVLPHFQLERACGQSYARINVLTEADSDADAVQAHCQEALRCFDETFLGSAPPPARLGPAVSSRAAAVQIATPVAADQWQAAVRQALAHIRQGRVRKVVLSHIRELRAPDGFDCAQALQRLGQRYSDCYLFFFQRDAASAFLGASPELLCSVRGSALESMALAGTEPRFADPQQDARSRRRLQASDKNQREHRVVVDAIVQALERGCAAASYGRVPNVLSLENVHHLCTDIRACCPEPKSVLEWAEILHPTPALGGVPRQAALELLDALEGQPRGWYGAPFGLVDVDLNGTFATAIRSGVVHGNRAWLFAGAGIVDGSDPQTEWAETGWKYRPLQEALTASAGPGTA